MIPDKKQLIKDDEIDLVELLGVLIKHRKFIIYFVIIATFLGALFLFFKEHRNSITVEKSYKLENSMSTNKDAVFSTFLFLKKGLDQENYNKFLSSILFPSKVDAPDFEIVNKRGYINVIYLFHDEESSNLFMEKYNALVDNMGKLVSYRTKLSEEAFSNCRQFNSIKGNSIDKDMFLFFKNTEDMKYCNLFNYYYTLIQSKITYALDNSTVPEAYIPFIMDFMKDGVDGSLLTATLRTEKNKEDIKITAKSNFSKKKVIKYTFLIMVLSGLFSVFIVFVIEFWQNNKSRLNNYWGKNK